MKEKLLQAGTETYLKEQAKELAEKVSRRNRERKVNVALKQLEALSLEGRMRLLLNASIRITEIEQRLIPFTEEPFILISAFEKFYKNIPSNTDTESVLAF
jgi:hypothetical protein